MKNKFALWSFILGIISLFLATLSIVTTFLFTSIIVSQINPSQNLAGLGHITTIYGSWLPIILYIALFIGLLAILFSVLGFRKIAENKGKVFNILGLIFGIVSLIIFIYLKLI